MVQEPKKHFELYTDVYRFAPVVSSQKLGWLGLRVDFFEAPGTFQVEGVFSEHHLLINLKEKHFLRQKRDARWHDLHLKKGDFVLTPAGLSNAWEWEDQSKVLAITITSAFLEQFAAEELHLRLDEQQFVGRPQGHDPLLNNLAEILFAETVKTPPSHPLYVQSIVNALLVHLLQSYGQRLSPTLPTFDGKLSPAQLRRVEDYIQGNLEKNLSLGEIAKVAGLSPYHFSRLFKKSLGVTPHQFLIRARVHRAASLLKNPALTLADIAAQVGFADQSHLTRQYRAILGVTPASHRRA